MTEFGERRILPKGRGGCQDAYEDQLAELNEQRQRSTEEKAAKLRNKHKL